MGRCRKDTDTLRNKVINMVDSNLVGKMVQLTVKFQQEDKPFCYHGKLMKITKETVELDDVKVGIILFPRIHVMGVRELDRMDYIYLANKFDDWTVKMKMQQADDKIRMRFEELAEKFRAMIKEDKEKYGKKLHGGS